VAVQRRKTRIFVPEKLGLFSALALDMLLNQRIISEYTNVFFLIYIMAHIVSVGDNIIIIS